MNDLQFFLTGLFISLMSLTLFIYLGSRVLKLRKAAELQRIPAAKRAPNLTQRRRSEIKPGIICSLPIHQRGSYEAPRF
jgi:hypothetical protein